MRFSKQKIEEIKKQVDIIDYAKKYFPELEPVGLDKWKVRCCFHNDSNPSLFFYSKKQNYYCFGCQRSGDVFDLVAHFENCDFQTAVNKVAEDLHLSFEPTGSRAVDYSTSDLKSLSGAPVVAKNYIFERGLKITFLEKYGVKYSPHLKAIAFPVYLNKTSFEPDYYFYRCITPYGLRYLIPPGVTKKPFNFFNALKKIQSPDVDSLYIFEGAFDCLAFLQRRQDEKVAALSLCGLSSNDIEPLENLLQVSTSMQFSKIIWCLDNDEAGKNAQLDLAFKFIKTHKSRNYFYAGNYSGHKDYADTLSEKVFAESISTELVLNSIDYLLRYYGEDTYQFENDLLSGREAVSSTGEIYQGQDIDSGCL